MSDMLNEKFEDLLAENDPMPSVGSSVVPGNPVASGYMQPVTGQTNTAVNAKASSGRDPMPSVPTSVVPGQSQEVVGGSTFEEPQGPSDPGAKAAKGKKKVQDGHVVRDNHQDPAPSIKSSGYQIPGGPNNTKVFGMEAIEYSSEEDINALTEGETLSPEFKEKASTIFEAAVKSRIVEQVKMIEEQYATKLLEEVEAIKSELAEQIDGTLNYTIGKWVEENQVAIDAGLRLEIQENFMKGLKAVFEENHLSIPDEKIDVVETMTEELCEMESRLNEQIERNIELNNALSGFNKTVILNQISEGLADTQKEKLASLSEGVEFISEDNFREKLLTLRESYFPKQVVKEAIDETPAEIDSEDISPQMKAYMAAIARWS